MRGGKRMVVKERKKEEAFRRNEKRERECVCSRLCVCVRERGGGEECVCVFP